MFTALVFLAYFLLTSDDRAKNDSPIFEINKVTIPIIIVLSVINFIIFIRVVTLCSGLEYKPVTKFMSYKGNHNLEVIEQQNANSILRFLTVNQDKFEGMMKVYGMSVDWDFRETVIQYKEEDPKKPDDIYLANSFRFWIAFYFNEVDKCRSNRVKDQGGTTMIKWKTVEDDFLAYK